MRFIPAVSPVQIQVPLPDPKDGTCRLLGLSFGKGPRPAWATWPVGQVVKTPPFHGGNTGSSPVRVTNIWRRSSAGRALASHARGHRFEFCRLHQKRRHAGSVSSFFTRLPRFHGIAQGRAVPPTRLRRDRIGAGGMDEDRFKGCKIWRKPLEIRLKLWDEAGLQRTGSHPVLCGPALLEQHLQKALEPIWFQSFDLVDDTGLEPVTSRTSSGCSTS